MAEPLFTFDKNNYRNCQSAYRGDNNQEYYLGECSIDPSADIDIRADKKSVGPCSIIRLLSRTRMTFKRSWYHIREDATDVVVLWFVNRGRLSISHPGGNNVVTAGDFALTKSMTPFSMECDIDEEGRLEVLHMLVPSHLFRRFVPQEVTTGFSRVAEGKLFDICMDILNNLLDGADDLSERTEQLLVDGALSVLSDAIRDCDNLIQERQSLADRRLQEVLRYIEIHLSDPALSTATVAEACNISLRYMSLLLKQHGTSFKELVWDKRLKIARRWLASTKPTEISIAEIAFRVGFKSPAHFSRMFKRVYGKGPREYRNDYVGSADGGGELFSNVAPSAMQ